MNLIIYLTLLFMGCLIGAKKRVYLIYGLLFLLPFYDVGYFTFLPLKMSEIIKYTFAFPMVIVLGLSFVYSKRILFSHAKTYAFVVLFLAYFILPVLKSTYSAPGVIVPLFILQFVVFLYVIENFEQVDFKVVLNILKMIIVVELLVASSQFLGDRNALLHVFFTTPDFKNLPVGSFYRATGTFIDPNYFALYIAVITTAIYRLETQVSKKIVFGLMGVLPILFSVSRMGIVMILLMWGVLYAYRFTQSKHKGVVAIEIYIFLMIVVLILQTSVGQMVINLFVSRGAEEVALSKTPRLQILVSFFRDMLTFKEWIWGIGFESFADYMEVNIGESYIAHNQYVQMVADIGLVGTGIVLAYLADMVNLIKNHLKDVESPLMMSMFVLLVGGLFLTVTYQLYIALFYGFFIAPYLYASTATQEELDHA